MRIRQMLSMIFVLSISVSGLSGKAKETGSAVQVWEEPLVLPTYALGDPDPNPRFYAGRAYQGAQGRVYPYAMWDDLTESLEDREYKALYLENKYLKICV
ncbi:MAG: hypothetical protein ACWGQW_08565, partial [bacterium]